MFNKKCCRKRKEKKYLRRKESPVQQYAFATFTDNTKTADGSSSSESDDEEKQRQNKTPPKSPQNNHLPTFSTNVKLSISGVYPPSGSDEGKEIGGIENPSYEANNDTSNHQPVKITLVCHEILFRALFNYIQFPISLLLKSNLIPNSTLQH